MACHINHADNTRNFRRQVFYHTGIQARTVAVVVTIHLIQIVAVGHLQEPTHILAANTLYELNGAFRNYRIFVFRENARQHLLT